MLDIITGAILVGLKWGITIGVAIGCAGACAVLFVLIAMWAGVKLLDAMP